MIDFTVTTEIARTPTEVFAYVTDPTKLPTWQTTTVSSVQEGDAEFGVGTKLREIHRGPGGREMESLVEVSRYEPGNAFDLRMLEGPLLVDAELRFTEIPEGTRVEFRAFGQPTGVLRLLQPMLKRTLRKQFAEDLETLGAVLAKTD
jgi:uncharacterized protein YndB with AHSA1/START domain